MNNEHRGHPRILMVEDNWSLTHVFREMCQVQGLRARVETCGDGNSTIDLLLDSSSRDDPFKLLIVDVFLPKDARPVMDPEALGVKILTSYQLLQPGTPIIVITAFPRLEICVQCLKAGAYDYLPKGDPTNQDSFLKILVEKCKSILFPEPDPLANWLRTNWREISALFAGQHIAIVNAGDAIKSKVPLKKIGEKAVIGGRSMEELRLLMLQDPVLRWTEPSILHVSAD